MPIRHYSIDYIRAACILYLMGFWHLFEYTGIPHDTYNNEITRRISTVVLALLVLISGYLCGGKPITGLKDLGTYYAGRFWRLYPPFLLACFLFFIMGIDPLLPLLHCAGLISMFTKVTPRTLWFIDMLVMFYALAPLFLWARDKVWLCLLTLAVVLGLAWGYDMVTHTLDKRVMLFLPCFVGGILMARQMPKLTWGLAAVLAVAWVASAWLTVFIPYQQLKDSLLQVPLGLVSAIGLFLIAYTFIDKIRTPKIVAVISYASYFMYLFHRPLYRLVTPLLKDLSIPVRTVTLICVVVPVLICLAYLMQKAYDALVARLLPRAA